MFCHKCGSQSLEDSTFCQKCGAKLIREEGAIQSTLTPIAPPEFNSSASMMPRKKKKWPLFLLLVGSIIVIVILVVSLQGGGESNNPNPITRDTPPPTPSAESVSPDLTVTNEMGNANTTTMYSSESYPFVSAVPDFLAFISEGNTITNESSTEINNVNMITINFRYIYDWNDDERNGYHDLLRDFGFELQYTKDGIYEWNQGDICIESYFNEPGFVNIMIMDLSIEDGPGNDYYYEDGYADMEFRRTDYINDITQADLLRYPDNNLYSKVFFRAYTVNNMLEPRVYLVKNGNNFLIIDDRNGSGANAVDNDTISVYGTFYGNQTVSFTDGRNQQVPHIIADKLIVNSLPPQDPADFALAYVEAVNRYSKAWSNENEYLSGTKVKLIVSSIDVGGVSDYFMPFEAGIITSFYVDGYSIPYFNVVIDGEPIGGGWSGSYGKMYKLPIPVEKGKMYVVIGDLELLFGMDGSSHARLYFESIEPYE